MGKCYWDICRVHIPKKSTKDDKKKPLNLPYNMYVIKFNPILSLKRPKTSDKILLIFLVHLAIIDADFSLLLITRPENKFSFVW